MKKLKCPACLGTGEVQNQTLLGKAMRALRVKPLRDVAEGMEMSPSHLCLLEQGKRRWTTDLINLYKEHCR